MTNVCVIGLGNMGKPIFDILKSKRQFKVSACLHEDDHNEVLNKANIIIIAVKPQSFFELAQGISVNLSEKIIISIMAGISIEKLVVSLKCKKVVRTLPNLALKVGQSLTLWKAEGISSSEKQLVSQILVSFGDEIEVNDENKIDLIGVMSGCGPGFLAYFGEKMADFLVGHGIDTEKALKVALQTLIGTGEVLRASGWGLKEMRQRVSSKGGLTEAGVSAMEISGMAEVFRKGGEAAFKRGEELGG